MERLPRKQRDLHALSSSAGTCGPFVSRQADPWRQRCNRAAPFCCLSAASGVFPSRLAALMPNQIETPPGGVHWLVLPSRWPAGQSGGEKNVAGVLRVAWARVPTSWATDEKARRGLGNPPTTGADGVSPSAQG